MGIYVPIEHATPWSPYYETMLLLSLFILIGTLCFQYAKEKRISELHVGLMIPCALLAVIAFCSPLWGPVSMFVLGIPMIASGGIMGIAAALATMILMGFTIYLHSRLTFPFLWEHRG